MLPRPEAESILELVGNFEEDRVGLVGLGHDFRDPQRIEMLGHYQVASG